MEQVTLAVDGMSCGHCLRAVRGALERVSGARVETVQMGLARVDYDAERTTAEALAAAVSDAGYRAFVIP